MALEHRPAHKNMAMVLLFRDFESENALWVSDFLREGKSMRLPENCFRRKRDNTFPRDEVGL